MKNIKLTARQRGLIALAVALAASTELLLAQSGVGGINAGMNEIKKYVNPITNLTMAIGGVVGIIGGAGTANGSMTYYETTTKLPIDGVIHEGGDSAGTYVNKTISNVHEEVVSRR